MTNCLFEAYISVCTICISKRPEELALAEDLNNIYDMICHIHRTRLNLLHRVSLHSPHMLYNQDISSPFQELP